MKIQWEYDLVEKPFWEQLKAMGWEWTDGDPDLPETTEIDSSSEVLLKVRLAAALRKLNLRAGQPWLTFKVVAVTDRTDLEGQLRETARLSGETLRRTTTMPSGASQPPPEHSAS